MFSALAKSLTEQGGGVCAYEACAQTARACISGEPENAAALLLVVYAAELFVEAYDDRPLTVEVAAGELERFRSLVTTLDSAYLNGSAEQKIAALNEVAAKLLGR